MAKVTIVFGVILLLLGLGTFVLTGAHFPTSLIPAGFGLLLIVLGALANTADSRRRALFMHIAVTVGLLGFLGTVTSLIDLVQLFKGKPFPHPMAVEEKAAMATLTLIFVVVCVRSFLAARRVRA